MQPFHRDAFCECKVLSQYLHINAKGTASMFSQKQKERVENGNEKNQIPLLGIRIIVYQSSKVAELQYLTVKLEEEKTHNKPLEA